MFLSKYNDNDDLGQHSSSGVGRRQRIERRHEHTIHVFFTAGI